MGELVLWLVGWLVAVVFIAWGFSRWVRFVRGDFCGQTPWEDSAMDPDYEVRWKDGYVESRRKSVK